MQGKHDKVIAALKRIAGINKKTLPDLRQEKQNEVTSRIENFSHSSNISNLAKSLITSKTVILSSSFFSFLTNISCVLCININ